MIEINKKRIINLLTIAVLLFSSSGLWAQTCTSMPDPVDYTRVGTATNKYVQEYAYVNGIKVTRILQAGDRSFDNIKYSNQDTETPNETYCGTNRRAKYGGKKYPFMDSNKVTKIIYTFSAPVVDVEVFLAAFGYSGTTTRVEDQIDDVIFSVDRGSLTLHNRASCNGTIQIVNGNEVKSLKRKTTDAKIGITSTAPFTQLTLTYNEPGGGVIGGAGFYVEICTQSIKPKNTSACNPTNINNNFAGAISATKTLNGVEVERVLDADKFASIGTSNYCGSSINYPNNLPYMGNTGARKLTYKFKQPVTSAEIFLFAFGEKDDTNHPNRYDEVKFSINGEGTMDLSQTYNCMPAGTTINSATGLVRSADNMLITTDVGIKVSSTKPFTEIVLDDKTPGEPRSGKGYVVEICASSITKANVDDFITLDAGISNLTNQTVCDGEAPVYKAKADATAFAATAKFDYILQAKKSGTTNWVTVDTKADVNPGTVHTFTGDDLKTTDYNKAKVRVKYVYKNSLFSVTGTAYSNEVTLTVNELPKVTKVEATPGYILNGASTPISFTITGTANATVTYTLNGGTPLTRQINGSGVATVPYTTAQDVTLNVTQIKKNGCITSITDKSVTVGVSKCAAFPAPQFGASVTGSNKQTMGNVEVTRSFDGGTPTGSPSYGTQCSGQPYSAGYILLRKETSNASKVTYHFSQPVTSAEVWLLLMSNQGVEGVDKAKITTNCASATLTKIYDCSNTATLSGDEITSTTRIFTDVAIRVESVKPFTELYVEDLWTTGSGRGFMVELCPSSLVVANTTGILSVATQPANVSACQGGTASIVSKANVGTTYLGGTLTYQWEESANNGATWANATGAGATGTATPGSDVTYTLSNVASASPNKQYRVKYSYIYNNGFCGEATIYSQPAKLIVPSASDIITIVAAQPSNVTTADCTQTTNVSAQAKIADGYTINNVQARGGNIFGYYLEFKDTDNTWKTFKGQQYSNNTSNHPQTLKIVHSQAPEGTTHFRVRYTVELTIGCEFTLTSNEFTFTKNLPAEPAITTPQTFCQSDNKTLAGLTTLSNIKWYNAKNGGTEVLASTVIPVGTKSYWATITTNGCESTRKEIVVTVDAKPTAPTVQTKTECPATGNYDMKNLVTSIPTGNTLKWYAAATGNTTTNSQVDRNKTAKTTYEKWVALVNSQGCEGDRVKVTYIVDITTQPTITAPTNNLSINCADSAAAINTAVTAWLNTATATVGCGTPTITNNYNAVKPTDFCSVGEIEVTFTVRDAFGNQNTAKKKITVDRLIANNDTESVSRSTGKDIDVLANDTKNGQPATKDNVKVQIVNANSTGATVTPDGKIRIPGGTLATGLHNITYKICDKDNPSRCGATATLAVTVTNSTIEANNDTPAPLTYATSVAYAKNTDGTELNVLANDKLSGVAPTLSQVTIIPVTTATGVSIEPATGKVKVNASTPAGVYNLTYKIKENGTSNESTPAKVTVVVKNTLTATPATLTPSITPSTSATTPKVVGDVLDQTALNGNKPNTSQVDITVTQQATPIVAGDPVPSINTTTGKVEIPSGVKPGTYTIKYKLCDKVTPQTCTGEVTLPITVAGGNTIVAQDDDFSAHKVERSSSEEVVKNGANPVNVLTNDELDTRTGLDTNVVTITQTSPASAVNIDTATGQIKVAANTPAGVYEVKYKITEKGQTTASGEATAKVVVINKLELDPAAIPATVNPPTDSTPKTIANVLHKAKINGNVPTISDATVEVVTPAPAAPGEVVPYIDPATGNVIVPSGTKVGNHQITYKVCDKATPAAAKTCKTTTINIPVTGNTPTAVADDFSAHKVERSSTDKFVNDGTNDVNVLSNDALGSNTNINTALVTINQTSPVSAVNIDTATGKVKVAANTPAGEYTVKYTLTQKGGTTASAEVAVKVVVTNKLELGPGSIPSSVKPATRNTPVEIGDVLDGTKLNGTPTTVGSGPNQVTIAVVTPATPQGSNPVPTLDTTTGKVKIPAGVPAGPYTIKYKICDNATPASAKSCEEKTLTINVAGNNLTPIADDDFSTFKVEKPAANTFVKNGANDVNVLTNDKLGDRIGLDTNVVEITQTSSTDANVGIDVATGKVKVGPGANAGVHTITYTLKEKGQSNVSTPVTVKVTVTNKVVVNPATIPANPSENSTTPKEIGNVLNQTTINGSTPSINDVTITATPSAPGSPKKPYIDTTTGKVMIPSGVDPGDHTISYTICDKVTPASAKTCKTATITVKVTGNTITPADDDFSAYKVEHPTTQTVVSNGANHVNILTNDKLGNRTGLTKDEVIITQTTPANPHVNIDTTNGEVDVQAGTPAGEYTVKYKITEKGQPTSAASAEKTVKVVVTNKLVNTTANYSGSPSQNATPAIGGDVLDNVRINDATSNPDVNDVTVSIVTVATGTTVPFIEISGADAGKIKIPQGTPAGNYEITYKVCDKAQGAAQSCQTATAKIRVSAKPIVANNDTDNAIVEYDANAAQNVKKSGTDLNVLANDKLGTAIGLNSSLVTIETTQSVSDIEIKADGKVEVAAGKDPGVYELKYKIKEAADPTNVSEEGTVKVVVKNKVTNDPFPTTPVNPSTDNNTPAERINILDKVKINGNTPSINDVTIEVINDADPQSPGDEVPELDPTTGKIKVPAGVKPGAYQIKYKVCDKVPGEANSCVVHEITVNVAGNDITAVADDFTAHKVERSNTDTFVNDGTDDLNVLTNDKLGARTGLTTDLVTITPTVTNPNVSIDTNTGKVKVAANALAGTHTVKYKITEKGQTTASAEVEVKVAVTNKIELDHTAVVSNPVTPSADSTTPKQIGDVLDGIKLNGTKPTIGTGPNQVTITVTDPADPQVAGDPVPSIDGNTGEVKIPAGVKPGNYNITYKVCDNATPQTCETTTITVQVQGNTTTAVGDDFSAHKVEHPTTNTFVNDGTNDVNVLSNDKLGNNSNITTNEVTITQTDTSDPRVNIDIATGKVKVDANTPVGEYTVKYKFTEKGQTIASEEKEVKVVVSNKLVNSNANYGGTPSTNSTPANGGNVLDNVRINDATSNPAPSDVTITVDQTAGSGTVPYLETSGPDAGKIKIPQGTPSGPYTIKYTVCDKAPGAAKSCKQATATVTVGTNPIVVNPTTKRVPKTGGTVDVLDNVTIGGNPADKNNVDISIVNDGGTGATIDPATGKINVPSGLTPGTHTITYKVCEKGSITNCQTNTLKVVIPDDIVVTPAPDAVVPKTGGTANVLDNTTVNGNPATKDKVDVSIVNDGGTGATVDPTTGKIIIPSGQTPGTHIITYKVCEKGQTDNCKTDTLKVVVPADLVLTPDNDVTVPKTGGTVDVLANDTVNGNPATKDNVDISIVDPDGTNASIDPATGKIIIPSGQTPGTHTITYKICEKGIATNCQTGTQKVVIPSDIVVNPAPKTVIPKTGGTANVLDNTTVNGNPATKDKVDVSIVNDGGTGATVDPATGKINVPGGLAPGEYTITYKVCEKGIATNCQTGTLKVVVPADIVLNPDEGKTVPKTGGPVDVLGNDTVNGNPATKDNVDISITDDGGTGATIDATGKIVIPDGATPGEHIIRYKVCEKGTNRCEEGTVKVVVAQEHILANADNYEQQWSATETVAKNERGEEANILANDELASNRSLSTNLVDIEQVEASSDKVSIDTATGKVKIAAGAPVGPYTLKYTIKPKGQTTPVSAPAIVIVVVKNKVEVTDDEISGTPSDSDTPNEIGNVTDNIKLNGQKPKPSDVTIQVVTPAESKRPGASVPTIDAVTGKITVGKDVPKGDYTIRVKVCDKDTPATCVEKDYKIRVRPNQSLQAIDDEYTLGFTKRTSVTTGGSVLDNDKLADKTKLSTDDVTVDRTLRKAPLVVDNDLVIMNEDGYITIKPGLPEGTYTYYYTIRTKDNSQTAEAKVVIHISKYVAADDTITVERPSKEGEETPSETSVLDNDRFNGEKPEPGAVDITLISVSESADGKIELDTTTGKIKVKPGAPIGEHTLKYKVCPKGSTTGCQEGEAKVTVQPNLTLKELTLDKPINSAISETHTDSVLNGSTLDGQPISPSDVTMEIVNKGGINGVTINADGQITIPKGAPSGTYTIEYKVKSNAYGVEKIGRVTVTITNDADLEFYNAISTDEGSQNNGFIIKNIDLYPNNNLKIFNRYGVLVYEKDGYTNTDPFKGISTGRATVNKDGKLPQGTYYYVLEYTDGQNQKQQKAGWLYIK